MPTHLQIDHLDLCPSCKPAVVSLQGCLADSVELVEERRNKAAGSPHVLLRSGVLRCDLVHQNTGQDSQESVGWVASKEAAGYSSDGTAGLYLMSAYCIIDYFVEGGKHTPVTCPRSSCPFSTAMTRSPSLR